MPFQRDEITRIANAASIAQRVESYLARREANATGNAVTQTGSIQSDIVNPRYLMFRDDPNRDVISILSADGHRVLRVVPRREWINYSQGQRDEFIAPLVEAEVQRALSINRLAAQPRRWSDGIDTPNIGARRGRQGRAERWNGSNWEAVDPLNTGWAARGERERPQFPGAEEARPVIAVADAHGNQTRITLPPDGMEAEDL